MPDRTENAGIFELDARPNLLASIFYVTCNTLSHKVMKTCSMSFSCLLSSNDFWDAFDILNLLAGGAESMASSSGVLWKSKGWFVMATMSWIAALQKLPEYAWFLYVFLIIKSWARRVFDGGQKFLSQHVTTMSRKFWRWRCYCKYLLFGGTDAQKTAIQCLLQKLSKTYFATSEKRWCQWLLFIHPMAWPGAAHIELASQPWVRLSLSSALTVTLRPSDA